MCVCVCVYIYIEREIDIDVPADTREVNYIYKMYVCGDIYIYIYIYIDVPADTREVKTESVNVMVRDTRKNSSPSALPLFHASSSSTRITVVNVMKTARRISVK